MPALPVRAATFTFGVYLNNTYSIGFGPPNTAHTVTLYAPGGAVADQIYTTSTGTGQYYANWEVPVIAGSKIKAAAAGDSRTFTVPNLSVRVNRVTDVANGKAPAGSLLSLSMSHNTTLNPSSGIYLNSLPSANSSGDWSIDLTPQVNLTGSDQVSVNWFSSNDDQVQASAIVPYMVARRSSSHLTGAVNLGATATIELRKASNALRGTATAAWTRFMTFEADVVNSSGDTVDVRSGNKLGGSFATDANITIPSISVAGDASSEQVNGLCMPNAPYSVYVRRGDFSASETHYGTTNGTGTLTSLFMAFNLMLTDKILLTCRYGSGDRVAVGGYVVP
jgi:hypothetical protein